MATNPNYYNLQEQRRYPLDDTSTGTGDDGTRIHDGVLADCRIRWPRHLGTYAFVSGITVTDKLVSVIILAANNVTTGGDFAPLAAVTIPQPVAPGRPYPLQPLADGVGGWLVFGHGVREPRVLRFATPAQGLLAPKCAQSYAALPIPTLGKEGRNQALTGLITIKGGNDVEVVKETVEIEGTEHDALVVRLVQDPGSQNVLARYLGPCDSRPESGNCGREGIEYLHGVAPDCDGNITIRVVNADAGAFDDCGGISLHNATRLDEVCTKVPQGVREWQDLCGDASSESVSSESTASVSETSESLSSEAVACEDIPYHTAFDDDAVSAAFAVVEGEFDLEYADSPEESEGSESGYSESLSDDVVQSWAAQAGYMRNIAVLQTCDGTSLDKACEIGLRILTDRPKRNGGIVVNYHTVTPLTDPHVEYFLVLVDMNVNKVRVLRYNGKVLVEEYSSPTALRLMPGAWYKLRVTTQTFGDQVALAVTLTGIDDPGAIVVSFSLATSRFGEADGLFGVGSDKGHAQFSYFKLDPR